VIPAEEIAAIRARYELVSFIEAAGIKLKRSGKGYLGLCPFHRDEKTLSLSVDAQKQLWCCLGACSNEKKAGGDVIEFARRLWGVGFLEAIERLGGGNGNGNGGGNGHVRQAASPRVRPAARTAAPPDLLEQVARFYHQTLAGSSVAKQYLAGRGITNPDLVSALAIGYADGSLLERAPEGSETRAALEALGVMRGGGHELMHGCIVVPLRDLAGNVVGLYGRPVDRDGHYFLPGERRGLVNAQCAATSEEILITESVFDALSFLEAGIQNAVPIYGTFGWTPDHDALLEKHRIRRIVLALDSDAAGQNASEALVHKLTEQGIAVRNIVLPAKDANELLVREGASRFREIWRELVAPSATVVTTEEQRKEEATTTTPTTTTATTTTTTMTNEDGAHVLRFGARTYRVSGLAAVGLNRMRVTLRVEGAGRRHDDLLDLYSARSRTSFITTVAELLGAEERAISSEVDQIITALERERLAMRARETAATEPQADAMSADERSEALGLDRDPRLAQRIVEDLAALGCVGEPESLLIAYLAALSRKLPEPLSVLFCARSGAGKSTMQDRICEITPPEDLVSYTSVTGRALFYADENALKHKLLAIDEEDGAAEAAYALRSLQSAGQLKTLYTRSDPQSGKQKAEHSCVEGPTAIFCTTAHPEALDYETRNRFLILTVNESKEQTRRILERQRWNYTIEGLRAREDREAILRRQRNAQRLIEPIHVVIPATITLPFPWEQLILRREHKKFLTLVAAITLLHQHQRERKADVVGGKRIEYIEATQGDADLANALVPDLLRRNLDELSPPARSLVRQIFAMVGQRREAAAAAGTYFDRKEIQRFTGLSVWHIKTYLVQLAEYEYIAPVAGKKGRRYLYELVWDGVEDDPSPPNSGSWR
jgi:DNA primase catalytic core